MHPIAIIAIGVGLGWFINGCTPAPMTLTLPIFTHQTETYYYPSGYTQPTTQATAIVENTPYTQEEPSTQAVKSDQHRMLKSTDKPRKKTAKHGTKTYPPKPRTPHQLYKVDDTNFDPDYMYPETSRPQKKAPQKATPASNTPATGTMDKARCVKMLGQEKFTRFVTILGSEAATIKRCALMQRMR